MALGCVSKGAIHVLRDISLQPRLKWSTSLKPFHEEADEEQIMLHLDSYKHFPTISTIPMLLRIRLSICFSILLAFSSPWKYQVKHLHMPEETKRKLKGGVKCTNKTMQRNLMTWTKAVLNTGAYAKMLPFVFLETPIIYSMVLGSNSNVYIFITHLIYIHICMHSHSQIHTHTHTIKTLHIKWSIKNTIQKYIHKHKPANTKLNIWHKQRIVHSCPSFPSWIH